MTDTAQVGAPAAPSQSYTPPTSDIPRDEHGRFAPRGETAGEVAERTSEADRWLAEQLGVEVSGDGVKAKTPAAKPQPQEEKPAPETDRGEVEAAKETKPDEDQALIDARNLARRLNLSRSVVNKMTPEELLDFAAKNTKTQANLDNIVRERDELAARLKETPGKPKESKPNAETDRAAADAPFDLKSVVAPFIAEYDEQAGGALAKVFEQYEAHQAQRVERLQAELARRDETMAGRDELLRGLLWAEAKRGLEGRYPQLADPAVYAKAREATKKLDRNSYAESEDPFGEMLEDGLSIVLRNAPRSETATTSTLKASGQPMSANLRAPQGPRTLDENGIEALKVLDSGGSMTDAFRAMGG